MTRVTESTMARAVLTSILNNKEDVAKYGEEVSTGIKVTYPGDSNMSGTISSYQETLRRVEGYNQRITTAQSFLNYQDEILAETGQVLVRAKEIATQGANEVHSPQSRPLLAEEVFQLRDHLVSLANSVYQGKYVYGGAADDQAPFGLSGTPYTVPASGPASEMYIFGTAPGITTTRSVNITDNLAVTVNTPGDQVFADAIRALEHLGRALSGYTTNTPPTPDTAYTLPDQLNQQTQDVASCIDEVQDVMTNDINTERASVAGRLRRLDTAVSVLNTTKSEGQTMISHLQDADISESASALSLAQTALQASYTVTSRVINLTILDFL